MKIKLVIMKYYPRVLVIMFMSLRAYGVDVCFSNYSTRQHQETFFPMHEQIASNFHHQADDALLNTTYREYVHAEQNSGDKYAKQSLLGFGCASMCLHYLLEYASMYLSKALTHPISLCILHCCYRI